MMKVAQLKRQARRASAQLQRERDSLPCGHNLAITINPRIYPLEQKFNQIMSELKSIDPNFPQPKES